MYINIHSTFQALCDGLDISSQSDQEPPQAIMGDLNGALQLLGDVPLGTIEDAWKPCPLLEFERDISTLTEADLERTVGNIPQAQSKDPERIVDILFKWRNLYLKAQTTNQPRSEIDRYKTTVEAIRAKARLLLLQKKSNNWLQNTMATIAQVSRWCVQHWLLVTCSLLGISQGAG